MSYRSPQKRRMETLRIVAIYALFGLVWIYGSDKAVGWLAHDPAVFVQIAVVKGSLFIICTATLLYFLISRFAHELATAERGQIESLKNYEAIFNATNEAIFVHDVKSGRIVDINDRVLEMFGYSRDEALSADIGRISEGTPPYSQEEAVEMVHRAMLEGPQVFQWLCRRKSGELFWTEVSLRKISIQGDDRVIAVVRDINERKQLDDVLRKSEELHRTILQTAMGGFWRTDTRGGLLEVNESYCRMSGYSEQELLAISISDLEASKSPEEIKYLIRLIMEQGEARFDSRHRRKDGTVFDVEVSVKYLRVGDGQLVIFLHDITDRKLSERALKESEERWKFALEGAGDGLWDWDAVTNHVYFSRQWKAMLGYAEDEFGDTLDDWEQCVHPEDRAAVFAALDRHFRGETEIFSSEYRIQCKNGTYKWILDRGKVIEWTEDGKPRRVIGTHTDISYRKLAEAEALLNVKRLRGIVSILQYRASTIQEFLDNALNEAIQLTDSKIGYLYFYFEDGKQFFLNSWSKDVMQESAIANPQKCYELEKIGVWGEAIRQHRPIIQNDYQAEQPLKKGDPQGHAALKRFITVPVFKDDRIAAVVGAANKESDYGDADVLQLTLLMDVLLRYVENRRGEDERSHLHDIIERSMNEIYVFDAETLIFKHANQGALNNLQYSLDEILNLTPVDLKPEMTETSFRAMIQPLLADEQDKLYFQTVHRRADGSQYPVEVNLQLVQSGSERVFLAVINDITDRKQAESEKATLENRLQQAQKMESIGRLAGGVAHDFNNMLSVIIGHADLVLMTMELSDPLRNSLLDIRSAAKRSADLTRQLLAFARRQAISPVAMNLNDAISGLLKMLQRLIGEDIHLTWQPASDLWLVKADPSQIDQVLANLCVNARDAIENTGRLTIETRNCAVDGCYCRNNPDAVPGEYVRFSVSDDGSGMDRETQAHIFEPFYTTKELGKGTGLGLATVFGIVKQNGGFINVYSEPGKGTTFSIYLPRLAEESPHSPSGGEEAPIPGGHETVLLVEDETSILKMTSSMLGMQGYNVLSAESPKEAILMAREHSGEIHLLLTDVIMPEINGSALAKILRSDYPKMKFLFMSGYTADVMAQYDMREEEVNFIQKPFSLSDLAVKVREVLDE